MITKPTLILDTEKCRRNIKMMADKAKRHHIEFRPHFKTHQSLEIGRWFREEGVSKITVSSLDMANYFAKKWNDITVAFPVNLLEIETINLLAKRVTLNVLIESEVTAMALATQLLHPVNFYIKINVGNNRAGIEPLDHETIQAILDKTKHSETLHFKGFLGHAGQTYKSRSKNAVLIEHEKSMSILLNLKSHFYSQYPDLKLSLGDTPSCSIANDFSGIDEIRPGNFVFYDITQCYITSCNTQQIAVAMACPIVAIHPKKNEVIIYGGGIHLSKDRIIDENGTTIYGKVCLKSQNGWSNPLQDVYIKSLSQEHGVIHVPKKHLSNFNIADHVFVLPVHSCMSANLMKRYITSSNKAISMFNPSTL